MDDVLTARLRLVSKTPALLNADAEGAQKLSAMLHAHVPAEWPDSNWEPHVLTFIRQQFAEHPSTIGWHRYVLLGGEQETLIGTCNAHPLGDSEAEIGYAILQPWRHVGYATEATKALLRVVFDSGMQAAMAHTFPHLPASIRVMEKCGFTLDGPGEEGTVRYRLRRPF